MKNVVTIEASGNYFEYGTLIEPTVLPVILQVQRRQLVAILRTLVVEQLLPSVLDELHKRFCIRGW